MSQQRRENCPNFSQWRPSIAHPDLGAYTFIPHPPCIDDVWAKRTGRGKTCEWLFTEPLDNLAGLASRDPRESALYVTERGPVRLAYGGSNVTGFMPTSAALSMLPSVDTRITAISDRYYR